jgi:hypothetical protein
MGPDSDELLLAIEDTFHISISTAEAGRILTAEQMHALILSKLPGERSNLCLTSAAFFALRLAIMHVFSLRRSRIRPSTPLGPMMPFTRRRALWLRLEQTAGLRLPELEPSLSLHLLLILAAVTVAIVPLYTGVLPADPIALGIFLLIVSLVVYLVLLRITPILRLAFPLRHATVGALAREVMSLNQSTLADRRIACHEAEVWTSLCNVIARQMQSDPTGIRPSDRLTRDLGIDEIPGLNN